MFIEGWQVFIAFAALFFERGMDLGCRRGYEENNIGFDVSVFSFQLFLGAGAW